jgi:hypothetical protein
MSDLHGDPDRGFRRPRVAVSDHSTGKVIDLPEAVAAALLDREPAVRLAYERYVKMAGQWMAPPEQRGRLIVFDQELVERVLGELPAEVLSELRAVAPDDEDEPAQEERPPDDPPPHEQLPLDRHLRELMGDQFDVDSPMFISPVRRGPMPGR